MNTFLIILLLLYGTSIFPMYLAANLIALPIIGLGAWFWWRRRNKKTQKDLEKALNPNQFKEFTNKLSSKTLIWNRKKGNDERCYYHTQLNDWQMEVFEQELYQYINIRINGKVILRVTYYPDLKEFGEIVRNKNIIEKMRSLTDFNEVEYAIAFLMKSVKEQSWKECYIETEDEEQMMKEINQWIKEMDSEELTKQYKKFQTIYAENIRYELHMTEQEQREWKESLILLYIEQKKKDKKHHELLGIFARISTQAKRFNKKMEIKYPKKERKESPYELWEDMEYDMESWSKREAEKYFDYKKMYLSLSANKKMTHEEKSMLKRGWNKLFNIIHKEKDRAIVLDEQWRQVKIMHKQKTRMQIRYD